jgi:hypothetical protein
VTAFTESLASWCVSPSGIAYRQRPAGLAPCTHGAIKIPVPCVLAHHEISTAPATPRSFRRFAMSVCRLAVSHVPRLDIRRPPATRAIAPNRILLWFEDPVCFGSGSHPGQLPKQQRRLQDHPIISVRGQTTAAAWCYFLGAALCRRAIAIVPERDALDRALKVPLTYIAR